MCPRTASTIPLLWSLVSGVNPSTILAFPTSANINDSRFFVALKDYRRKCRRISLAKSSYPLGAREAADHTIASFQERAAWLRLTLNHSSDEHVVRTSAERQLSGSPSPVSAANFLSGLRRKLDTNCGIAGGSCCPPFS